MGHPVVTLDHRADCTGNRWLYPATGIRKRFVCRLVGDKLPRRIGGMISERQSSRTCRYPQTVNLDIMVSCVEKPWIIETLAIES